MEFIDFCLVNFQLTCSKVFRGLAELIKLCEPIASRPFDPATLVQLLGAL